MFAWWCLTSTNIIGSKHLLSCFEHSSALTKVFECAWAGAWHSGTLLNCAQRHIRWKNCAWEIALVLMILYFLIGLRLWGCPNLIKFLGDSKTLLNFLESRIARNLTIALLKHSDRLFLSWYYLVNWLLRRCCHLCFRRCCSKTWRGVVVRENRWLGLLTRLLLFVLHWSIWKDRPWRRLPWLLRLKPRRSQFILVFKPLFDKGL